MTDEKVVDLNELVKFDSQGLIPVVTQQYDTNEVLMLAYMNELALSKTLETGYAHYWSRSRNELWKKGETSGNTQRVKELYVDCDGDTLLLKVDQHNVACHTGNPTCFYQQLIAETETIDIDDAPRMAQLGRTLAELYDVILNRKNNPKEGSYTNYLFANGVDKILKKVGEESTEVIIASKNPDKGELVYETSDLLYHLLVLLVNQEVTLEEIALELKKRS